MKLTPQGEKFLPYVHQLLDLQSAACAAVQPTVAETVWRIGISEYFLTQQLQALLGWLQRASQGMRLELLWASSAELLRLWQSDAMDLIVVTSAEPLAEAQLLHREPLAWVSAPDHAPRPDQPAPLVLLGAECPVRHIALTALSRTGKAHELRLSCSGSQAAIAALRAGWGVGCLNASAIPEDLQRLSRLDARQWPSPGRLAFYGLARTELQPVLRSLGPWARRLLAGRRPHDSTAPQTS